MLTRAVLSQHPNSHTIVFVLPMNLHMFLDISIIHIVTKETA